MKNFTLLLLFLGISITGFSQEDEYRSRLLLAVQELERGAYDEAVKRCDEILKVFPDSPLVYVLKGEAIIKGNDRITRDEKVYKKAMAVYQKALDLDSTYTLALDAAMLLNILHQKYDKTIYYARLLIKHHDEDWQFQQGILNLANAYSYQGKFEKAIQVYEMGISSTPENANFYNNLGMTYNDLKDYEKAQECIHKAIELMPDDMGFKGNLAFLFTQMGKHEEAVLIYDEVLKVEVNPLAYNNRGYAKLQLGKPQEALKDINTSLKFYPTNAYAYKNRALVYVELKDKEKACQDLDKANKLGFSVTYGSEVNDLIEKHCKK